MKIEELIEKYNRIFDNSKPDMLADPFSRGEDAGSGRVSHEIVEDLKQLESSLPTQQTVEVPEFVAEYLEMRKDQAPVGGLGAALLCVFDGKETPILFNWMNNNVEVFARAWLDDYTVEKQQLYWAVKGVAEYLRCDGKIILFTKKLELSTGKTIINTRWFLNEKSGDKPATAEQIAKFKLAEVIANTGKSADQIRQMLSNGKMPMGPWLELQKTAEELQEVENNAD